ncbi:MAG: right-handed parallel beta-helix repeat-containing protein [Desulfobacterales bacterium]|nr:right-handed parallel beta-helix repeat-containing protein [Desulfobacterales bacterium]
MNKILSIVILLSCGLLCAGCGGGSDDTDYPPIIVNSLADIQSPPQGTVTLRSALASAQSGQTIAFEEDLDGGTIELSIVGAAHTILKGEVMGMRQEPSGPVTYLVGYFDRDYGKSALYARKNVVIDASALPAGITLAWTGATDARVLAVYGNLTLTHVTITGGNSVAEDISTGDPDDQPWTLARGGAVAVWGTARLVNCTLYDNHCLGDFDSSRDRGAFGGGVYANRVQLVGCTISGNTVTGGGAAGGGVYSVGGANDSSAQGSTIERCAVTGNRIGGLFVYGAGIYSDGGGIGQRKSLTLTNCTIAQNLAEPSPGLPPFLLAMGYWRGGAVYMSNGYLVVTSCTITQNEVYGYPRTDDLGKRNLAGAIAATIGNAHGVEDLVIGQSIVSGNTLFELDPADGTVAAVYDHDIFTGSLFYFKSRGHNRFGVLDFSQILVPVGETGWLSLCRKHYPKQGDADGEAAGAVLDLTTGVTYSDTILSAGVAAGTPAVLYYEPAGSALDRVPAARITIHETYAEYSISNGASDNFLAIFLDRVENHYGLAGFAAAFTSDFETFLQTVDSDDETAGVQPYTNPNGNPILTLADTQWFGPAVTWPKELYNYPYIEFWHRLDTALAAEAIPGMGPELIGDDAWQALFSTGALAENAAILMWVETDNASAALTPTDQLRRSRGVDGNGDIGAIEVQ